MHTTPNCYRFEEVAGENPLFTHIDATYVIHLEGNGRLESVRKELADFYPSKNTSILFNKGYKKCEKQHLPEQETYSDLVDANLTIFRDAKEKKYKTILILEDDFFFHKEVRKHTKNVEEFLVANKNKEYYYFLGCIPQISLPTFGFHNQVFLSCVTHAVIYSESFRDKLLLVDQDDIIGWDCYQQTQLPFNKYMYHTPICYQLFPETENSKVWDKNSGVVSGVCYRIMFQIAQWMALNVRAEPSYSILYFVSKCIIPLFLVIIAVLCFFAFRSNGRRIRRK